MSIPSFAPRTAQLFLDYCILLCKVNMENTEYFCSLVSLCVSVCVCTLWTCVCSRVPVFSVRPCVWARVCVLASARCLRLSLPCPLSAITLDNTLVILSTVAPDAGRYYVQAVNDKNGENKTSQPITLAVDSK